MNFLIKSLLILETQIVRFRKPYKYEIFYGSMGRGTVISIVIVLIVIIVLIVFLVGVGNNNVDTGKEESGKEKGNLVVRGEEETTDESGEEKLIGKGEGFGTHTIKISSSGFLLSSININQNDRIVFVNEDNDKHWPASDVHPTHRVYPGSDISKCQTPQSSKIFDSCHGLIFGERFEFVFNEKGSWNYHDHLNPSLKGTINVK